LETGKTGAVHKGSGIPKNPVFRASKKRRKKTPKEVEENLKTWDRMNPVQAREKKTNSRGKRSWISFVTHEIVGSVRG